LDHYDDYVLDYNDPFEINSLVDALFNRGALEKLFPTAHTGKRGTLHDIYEGGWQNLQGLWYVLNKGVFRPIGRTTGNKWTPDFKALGLNMLTNFSESMDILANPIKGLLLEKEGRNFLGYSGKGFARGLGMDPNTGRKNYDWNIKTGSGAADVTLNIVGEVLSDPLNWISLGGKAVVKTLADAGIDVLKEAAQTAAVKVGKEISEEAAERLAKQAMRQVVNNADMGFRTAAHTAVQRVATKGWIKPAVEIAGDIAFSRAFVNEMAQISADRLGMSAIRSVQKIMDSADVFEKVFMHGSTYGLLKGAGWALKRGAVNPILGYIDTHLRKATQAYARADGTIPLNKMEYALQNMSDAMKYKAMDSGEVAQYVDEQIKFKQIFSVQSDLQGLHDLLDKPGTAAAKLKSLNEYFLSRTDGVLDFDGYAKLLNELAEKYPHLESSYVAIRSVFDRLHALDKIESARELDKAYNLAKRTFAEAKRKIKTLIDDTGTLQAADAELLRMYALRLEQELSQVLPGADGTVKYIESLRRTADQLEIYQARFPQQAAANAAVADNLELGMRRDLESIWRAKPPANATPKQLAKIAEYEERYAAINWLQFYQDNSPQATLELNHIVRGIQKYKPSDPVVRRAFPILLPPKGTATKIKEVFESMALKQRNQQALYRQLLVRPRALNEALLEAQELLDDGLSRVEMIQQGMTQALRETLIKQTDYVKGAKNAIDELLTAMYNYTDE